MADCADRLQQQLETAIEARQPLCLVGGDTKGFLGRTPSGQRFDLADHRGLIAYEPSELFITARAGTPLTELDRLLAAEGQMLPFEPPGFGEAATIGGTIACNLSGPRRPQAGAARDLLLGVQLLNGKGERLRFGGQVMKNVAGYDLSRLMAGAMGTLGMLLEVSLKVLPRPEREITLQLELDQAEALARLHHWGRDCTPISGTCWHADRLTLRLSGDEKLLRATVARIGGETLPDGERFWHQLREQQHDFFSGNAPLWRLSIASNTPPLALAGEPLIEWGGALRWWRGEQDPAAIRRLASDAGGHASLFRHGDRDQSFQSLPPALLALHRRLKRAFDPHGLLNPGRLYPEF